MLRRSNQYPTVSPANQKSKGTKTGHSKTWKNSKARWTVKMLCCYWTVKMSIDVMNAVCVECWSCSWHLLRSESSRLTTRHKWKSVEMHKESTKESTLRSMYSMFYYVFKYVHTYYSHLLSSLCFLWSVQLLSAQLQAPLLLHGTQSRLTLPLLLAAVPLKA